MCDMIVMRQGEAESATDHTLPPDPRERSNPVARSNCTYKGMCSSMAVSRCRNRSAEKAGVTPQHTEAKAKSKGFEHCEPNVASVKQDAT